MSYLSSPSSESAAATHHVILVHGTGAAASNERGSAWWQTEGTLWRLLVSEYKDQFAPRAYIWSGENSERERRDAGRCLCGHLIDLQDKGIEVHLIGHSHGGSVIWHALQEFDRKPGRLDRTVRSWATVGTPFLQSGLRRARLWGYVIAMLLSIGFGVGALFTLSEPYIEYAQKYEPLATYLWFGLLLVPMTVFVVCARAVRPYLYELMRRHKHAVSKQLAGPLGMQKYLGLWSRQDEPTIGLGASGSFSIKLLSEGTAESGGGAKLPMWRTPFAVATNQFVNNLVSRAVQGSTLAHLELRRATSYPTKTLAQKSLPPHIDDVLIEGANIHSAKFGRHVRDLLMSGSSALTGFVDLKIAAAKTLTFKELVHTTYFDQAGCIELLVHHMEQHSRIPPERVKTAAVVDFYEKRMDAGAANSLETNVALPSNRIGLVVSVALTALLLTLAMVAFSQAALHRIAFAPTTPAFYASQIAETTSHLAAALIPDQDLPGVRRRDDLDKYVTAIVAGGQFSQLLDAATKLPEGFLRDTFETKVLPTAIKAATYDQLVWLVSKPRGFFAAMEPKLSTQGAVFPATEMLVRRLAEGGNSFDRQTYENLLSPCKQVNFCRGSLQFLIVHTVVRHGTTEVPDYMLPLKVPMGSNGEPVRVADLLHGLGLSREKGNEKFLAWGATRDLWPYVSAVRGNTELILRWSDYENSVLTALKTLDDVAIFPVLEFVLESNWTTTIPAEAVSVLKAALTRVRLPSASDRDWRTMNIDFLDIALARLSDHVGVCNGPQASGIIREPGMPVPCEIKGKPPTPWMGSNRPIQVETRSIASAQKAKAFLGNDGLLERLPGHSGTVYQPALKSSPLDLVLSEMYRDVCMRLKSKTAPEEMEDSDKSNLAKFFIELGPAPATIPDSIAAWLNQNINLQKLCAADFVKGSASLAAEAKAVYNLAMAQWLYPVHPEVAVKLVLSNFMIKSGAVDRPARSSLLGDEHAWLADRGRYQEILKTITTTETASQLLRRTTYFRLATCLNIQQESKLAQEFAKLGERAALTARKYGRPAELGDAYMSEALYLFSTGNYRAGADVCSACDIQAKLSLVNAILPFLFSNKDTNYKEFLQCQAVSKEDMKLFLGTEEQKVDATDFQLKAEAKSPF